MDSYFNGLVVVAVVGMVCSVAIVAIVVHLIITLKANPTAAEIRVRK